MNTFSILCETIVARTTHYRSAVSPVLSGELQKHQSRVSRCFCVCVCDLHVLAELGIVSAFCVRQLLPVLLNIGLQCLLC